MNVKTKFMCTFFCRVLDKHTWPHIAQYFRYPSPFTFPSSSWIVSENPKAAFKKMQEGKNRGRTCLRSSRVDRFYRWLFLGGGGRRPAGVDQRLTWRCVAASIQTNVFIFHVAPGNQVVTRHFRVSLTWLNLLLLKPSRRSDPRFCQRGEGNGLGPRISIADRPINT